MEPPEEPTTQLGTEAGLSVCLSVCVLISLSLCLPVSLSLSSSLSLSVCLSLCPHLSLSLSVCLLFSLKSTRTILNFQTSLFLFLPHPLTLFLSLTTSFFQPLFLPPCYLSVSDSLDHIFCCVLINCHLVFPV